MSEKLLQQVRQLETSTQEMKDSNKKVKRVMVLILPNTALKFNKNYLVQFLKLDINLITVR